MSPIGTIERQAVPLPALRAIDGQDDAVADRVRVRFHSAAPESAAPESAAPEARATGETRVGIWAEGIGSIIDVDDARSDGDAFAGALGIDGLLTPDLLLGVRIGFDDTEFDTLFDGVPGILDSDALSVTFYGAHRMGAGWVIDGHFGYTRSNHDFSAAPPGTPSLGGEVRSDRFHVGLGASAPYALGPVTVTPRVQAAIAVESAVAFTDTAGNTFDTDRSTVAQASAGAEVAYPLSLAGVVLEPWVEGRVLVSADDVGAGSLVGEEIYGAAAAGLRVAWQRVSLSVEARAAGFGGRPYTDVSGLMRVGFDFE
ncbi:MAG: autotransporter outer membrane beta-barrel domain-containing protein [Pseudomonadota bacterium]